MMTFKNDTAPVLFYFDIFTTDIFEVPIIPIPIRIDKIINGEETVFIVPNVNVLNKVFEKLEFSLDLKNFFIYGLKNLVKYAKKKFPQLTFRPFKIEKIFNWFEKSKEISSNIPSLEDDFTFLISEFAFLYSNLEKMNDKGDNDQYISEYLQYCDRIIKYFKDILEQNSIRVVENGELTNKMIYKEKKGKFYPEIVPVDVTIFKKNKVKKKFFVPYLIYDDIIDCFSYNRKILNEKSQTPFDMNVLLHRNIIHELEDKNNRKLKEFTFYDIDVGTLI